MRLLLELVVAAALIALAWNKSFKDWVSDPMAIGAHRKSSSSESTALKTRPPAPFANTSAAPKEFTGHIYYTDEQGKRYWLDAQGRRHYDK
ncbi:MAG TPA: hypothetical protein VM940_08920 [Chthoniobacterales bacterium]|jgi:hypothetical protein|nr:hypothetical protein [Chthoniobacterales bacterium]